MSVDLYVFLRSGHLPSISEWQTQLDALTVDLRLDPEVDPRSHTGYWPAELDGVSSGFEFVLGSVKETFGSAPPPGVGDREVVAQFVTHSDMHELKCSMLAAAALATFADGVVFDEDAERP